jgi:type I restriction enzyme S subunit
VFANKGDLLITVKGSGVGKMNILLDDGIAISRQLMAIRPFWVSDAFILHFLYSEYHALQNAKEGQIPGINREEITEKLGPVFS